MRYRRLKDAIEKGNMHDIVRRVTGYTGDTIPCPFHRDSGRSMTVFDDHVTCRECGTFNPVQYVIKTKEMTEREACEFCMRDDVPDYIETARELMRAVRREKKTECDIPEEYCGYIVKGILPVANEFSGTVLERDPLEEGQVIFLDEGFADSKGNIVGKPGFTKIKGRGEYVTVCPTYEQAASLETDSCCEADADTLQKAGRPVLALSEDQAIYLSGRHIRAGYMSENGICWIGDASDESGYQYHERGDLFNMLRCLPGINRWKLDDFDAWMYMTGESADISLEDFVSEEGKNVLKAMRFPQELHFSNTSMSAPVNRKSVDRIPEKAYERDASLLRIRMKRIPEAELPKRHMKSSSRGYFRFRKKCVRISGKTAVIMLGEGVRAETDVSALRTKGGFVYAPADGGIRFFRTYPEGSIELSIHPKSVKRRHYRGMRKRRIYIRKDEISLQGDRYRIQLRGGYISVQKKYVQAEGDLYRLSVYREYEFPIHNEDGTLRRKESGELERINPKILSEYFKIREKGEF